MSSPDKTLVLERLEPQRNKTAEVSERIAAQIRSGRLPSGARLPTEQELVTSLGVSRSVVREAVACLKSEGLVVTRQGAGAFVASDASRVPFRIDPGAARSRNDLINIMELRLATEVEAAALAAARASADQLADLAAALAAVDAAIADGGLAVAEDFGFHRAVALASGNPMFEAFLEFLGHHVIPRQSERAAMAAVAERKPYLVKIQREHQAIAEAIVARDVAGARRAMRRHLSNSLERQRQGQTARADATRAERSKPRRRR